MIIKIPLVLDVSNYELGLDISKLSINPSVLIAKVSEGLGLYDKSWTEFHIQAKTMGIPFAVFHFFHNDKSDADQAKFFWSSIQQGGGLSVGDRLILDFEQNNTLLSGHAAMDFFYNLSLLSGIPQSKMLLYSTAGILNNLNLKTSDQEYLLGVPTWSAGYPDNPDQFTTIPASYIPDPKRYGPAVMWQYSGNGVISGFTGGLDLSWIDPKYLAEWQNEYSKSPASTPSQNVPVVVPPVLVETIQLFSDGTYKKS